MRLRTIGIFALAVMSGCSQLTASLTATDTARKQGDTTAITTQLAKSIGEAGSTINVPGDLVSPGLAGQTVPLHVSGYKNIHLRAYNTDGSVRLEVTSDISEPLREFFGGAIGLDTPKFGFITDRLDKMEQFDERRMAEVNHRLDQIMPLALQSWQNRIAQQAGASTQPGGGGQTLQQQLLILASNPEFIAQLKAVLGVK